MANYGVVRLDNMSGTTDGTLLRSVRFYDNDKEAAIENGRVVLIGDLLDGQREVSKATAPAATSPLTHVGLVAAPELMYDERKHNLTDFINAAGENVRVYIPHVRDIFSVTADALDAAAAIAKGNLVELQAGTKLKVVATATDKSTQVGKIVDIETVGSLTYYVIEVG